MAKNPAILIFVLSAIVAFIPLGDASAQGLTVDTADRTAVQDFYRNYYCASRVEDSGWQGDISAGTAGDTTHAFKASTLDAINFYRAMVGIPAEITFKEEWNEKAQQAALMMSANEQLSHTPPNSWTHYTDEGAEAAGSSNLTLGYTGARAITAYIQDLGSDNYPVGHRRWILCPTTTQMGTGDVDPDSGYAANSLWVFDDERDNSVPDTAVMWPPQGYVPNTIIFNRWSFSYPDADFSNTTVSVRKGDQELDVTVLDEAQGYCDNTLVWTIDDDDEGASNTEVIYTVNISQVGIGAQTRSFSYDVIQFDANPALSEATLSLARSVDDDTGYVVLTSSLSHSGGCPISASDVSYTIMGRQSSSDSWETIREDAQPGYVYYYSTTEAQYKFLLNGTDVESNVVSPGNNGGEQEVSTTPPTTLEEAYEQLTQALNLAKALSRTETSDTTELQELLERIQSVQDELGYSAKTQKNITKALTFVGRYAAATSRSERARNKKKTKKKIKKARRNVL